jgi:hypothetical protein
MVKALGLVPMQGLAGVVLVVAGLGNLGDFGQGEREVVQHAGCDRHTLALGRVRGEDHRRRIFNHRKAVLVEVLPLTAPVVRDDVELPINVGFVL